MIYRSKTDGASKINVPFTILVILSIGIMLVLGISRIHIETDILKSLPTDNPVLSQGRYVIANHPDKDRVVIDVSSSKTDPDRLVTVGRHVEKRLMDSGLFKTVGFKHFEQIIPRLIGHIVEHLPVLFTKDQLENDVMPLIEPERIREQLNHNLTLLAGLEGIGQAELISADPLGLRYPVLKRLSTLTPSKRAHFYRGALLSSDRTHYLVIATPAVSQTDTAFSNRFFDLVRSIQVEINDHSKPAENTFTLTPVGAFRAAGDNERIARRDVKQAIFLATFGIAILLIMTFPRPYIGLLAMLPALAGTVTAFFVFSLVSDRISILAIGFGGAIISITVDCGIAYLLLLDQPERTYGKTVSREVWSVSMIAMLTTVCAFSSLTFYGFPIMSQIGGFSAMGIFFAFVFVHRVFPVMFPEIGPARKKTPSKIPVLVDWLTFSGRRIKPVIAFIFAVIMVFSAKLQFNADLRAMNTISPETRAAEKLISNVWGNVFDRIFIAIKGKDVATLQEHTDQVLPLLETHQSSGLIRPTFLSSEIFPGKVRSANNLSAWNLFWSKSRKTAVKGIMEELAVDMGFSPDAFDPFFRSLDRQSIFPVGIPDDFHELLGIRKNAVSGEYVQFVTTRAGSAYVPDTLFKTLESLGKGMCKSFDPRHYASVLGHHIASMFKKMTLIIALSMAGLLIFFFFEWKLALVAVLPIGFAFCCTLGTLTLLGHPLDIPALMLSTVVFGIGIDYSLFFVRSFQRFSTPDHPHAGLFRTTVFLAASSTLIGFGAMAFSGHNTIRSAGITSFLGIFYCLAGVLMILPPALTRMFAPSDRHLEKQPGMSLTRRIRHRFRYREMPAKWTAWIEVFFKATHKAFETELNDPKQVIVIGCRYGYLPAWLIEKYPAVFVHGFDPDPEKARIASIVVRDRGIIRAGLAEASQHFSASPDTVIILYPCDFQDMNQFARTTRQLHQNLVPEGKVLIRTPVLPKQTRIPRTFRSAAFFHQNHPIRLDKMIETMDKTGFDLIKKIIDKKIKNHELMVFRKKLPVKISNDPD